MTDSISLTERKGSCATAVSSHSAVLTINTMGTD